MIKELMHDPIFLAGKSEDATKEDIGVANDLLETLMAHRESCVGMAANMIGVRKRIIAFLDESGRTPTYTVMLNPVIVNMSEADVAKLITSGSLDAFLDALDFAPIGVIDLIKKLSITIPMVDIQKRKALKEKTGFDVEAALKHNEEDKEDDQKTILKTDNGGERRVKPDAAPAGRRTAPTVTAPAAAPKYNIVTKPAEEATAKSAE